MTQQLEAMKLALEALEKLWNIIDDIDTYGDMAKADEKLYRSLVERRQRTRFEETGISTDGYTLNGGAITVLRQAIEQAQKQEPVARVDWWPSAESDRYIANMVAWEQLPEGTLLYTSPPQRQPLTDEHCTWKQHDDIHMPDTWEADCGAMWTFTEGGPKDNDMHYCPQCGKPAIEAAHGIKGEA
jgi:hypothetical protein